MPRFLPLLLACALVPATVRPQQRPDPGFRAWLWAPADQPRNEALAEALGTLGFHGLSTEPGEDIGRLAALGIPYYVDQLVGGGVLGLDPGSWRRARAAALVDPPRLHRPKCLHEPKVLNAAKTEIVRRLAACADHPPAFVSLRDEPSFTSRLNPVDWCETLAARRGFVRFLENKWGSRDKIRDAWGLARDVDLRTAGPLGSPPPALAPMRTQTARDRLFRGRPDARALVQWNDTRTFADRTFSDAVGALASSARNALPGVPVGILGGQMPHTFGGFDWAQLCRSLRLIEVYDHGGVRELARSFASPTTRFLSTLVTADPRPPQAITHTAWHRFLQGDHEVVVYRSNDVFEERDPGRPTPWIQALSPHL